MTHGPYIGIAGITSRAQIDDIVEGWPDDAPLLAMGVLASYKTAIQRRPNKYPNRYPAWHKLPGLWSDRGNVAVTLHYSFAEDDMVPPRTAAQLIDELSEVRDLADSALWLQVNVRPMIRPWQAEVLARIANQWTRIIVQVSGAAMDQGSTTLDDVRAILATEKDKVTLLFDGSGGRGVPVDVDRVGLLITLCHRLGWSCGVAGGLSPETLPALRPLFDICPLSVDVESWTRDGDDRLDIGKARAFRDAALELYR